MNKTIIRLIGAAIIAALTYQATYAEFVPRLVISLVVGLPAFVLMVISRRQLGQSFTVMPAAKALITTGVYSRIQHPMYLFLDLFLAAIIVALNISLLLWIWGILVCVQLLQSQREEAVLRASFGEEYHRYANQTWF